MDRPKILVIDTDPEVCVNLEQSLSQRGYRVQTVPSATAALQLLQTETFPVVLTTLQLAGCDGRDVCRRIKRQDDRVIVYAMSAFRRDLDVDHLERVGFDGHLRKPLNASVLATAVAGAFERLQGRAGGGARP